MGSQHTVKVLSASITCSLPCMVQADVCVCVCVGGGGGWRQHPCRHERPRYMRFKQEAINCMLISNVFTLNAASCHCYSKPRQEERLKCQSGKRLKLTEVSQSEDACRFDVYVKVLPEHDVVHML